MGPGRSTPVAMRRPASAPTSGSPGEGQAAAGRSNRQENSNNPEADGLPTTTPHPPLQHSVRGSGPPGIRSNGSRVFLYPSSPTLFPSMIAACMSTLAAFSSTVAATVCLGWLVYSRPFRSDREDWKGEFISQKSLTSSNTVSNTSEEALGSSKATFPANSRPLESLPALPIESASVQCVEGEAKIPMEIACKPPSTSRTTRRLRHHDHAMYEKLRKHYDYLLSWLSNQHEDFVKNDPIHDTAIGSDNTMDDEFRQMSLRHFTDLSSVIYQDVRRRENDGSPERPQPSTFEPWMRNKRNESRMVLCRTINEQFSRLVVALVLEQARRLAELRIKMQRRGLVTR